MILDASTQVEETPHLHGSVVAHRTEQVDFVLVSFLQQYVFYLDISFIK